MEGETEVECLKEFWVKFKVSWNRMCSCYEAIKKVTWQMEGDGGW